MLRIVFGTLLIFVFGNRSDSFVQLECLVNTYAACGNIDSKVCTSYRVSVTISQTDTETDRLMSERVFRV